jgi:predicted nucleic acid-binding protein
MAERAVVILPRPVPRSGGKGLYHQDITSIMIRRHSANLVPEAHLVALALEYGLTVVSTDTDFARFPGATWLSPVPAEAS